MRKQRLRVQTQKLQYIICFNRNSVERWYLYRKGTGYGGKILVDVDIVDGMIADVVCRTKR